MKIWLFRRLLARVFIRPSLKILIPILPSHYKLYTMSKCLNLKRSWNILYLNAAFKPAATMNAGSMLSDVGSALIQHWYIVPRLEGFECKAGQMYPFRIGTGCVPVRMPLIHRVLTDGVSGHLHSTTDYVHNTPPPHPSSNLILKWYINLNKLPHLSATWINTSCYPPPPSFMSAHYITSIPPAVHFRVPFTLY